MMLEIVYKMHCFKNFWTVHLNPIQSPTSFWKWEDWGYRWLAVISPLIKGKVESLIKDLFQQGHWIDKEGKKYSGI